MIVVLTIVRTIETHTLCGDDTRPVQVSYDAEQMQQQLGLLVMGK